MSNNGSKPFTINRRGILKAGAATAFAGTIAMPTILRAQTPTVKVGVLEPLTGNLAYNGTQARAGAQSLRNEDHRGRIHPARRPVSLGRRPAIHRRPPGGGGVCSYGCWISRADA